MAKGCESLENPLESEESEESVALPVNICQLCLARGEWIQLPSGSHSLPRVQLRYGGAQRLRGQLILQLVIPFQM